MSAKATATARTLSLFTGKTDLEEGGGMARDGSPAQLPGRTLRRPPLTWAGNFGFWWTERRRGGKVEHVFEVAKLGTGEYEARKLGRRLGVYLTVGEAGAACERAR